MKTFGKATNGRFRKLAFYSGTFITTGYLFDRLYLDSAVTRSMRTMYYSGLILYDNKYSDLPDHQLNAQRLYKMISKNQGLYIKLGQIISMQSSMFPQEYQQVMKQFLDNAPSDPWDQTAKILELEMGPNYRDLIEIEHTPIASASIAQVHRGTWLPTGQKVAIKIQHNSITKQMNLDLLSYRTIMKLYEFSFEMPLHFISEYISKKLAEECDFNIEYTNTKKMSELISKSNMRNDVFIPELFYHSKRVLISEFIDGDPFKEIERHNKRKIMNNLITCFSRQIFEWGFVHCDPHPGNFLLMPNDKLCILDHGLYVHLEPDFRYDYCNLWKNLFELNFKGIAQIARKWGIGSPELFSGVLLSKPEVLKEQISHLETEEDINKFLKQQMLNFFENTDKFPLEIVFLSRAVRMLQLLNLQNGSPTNRVGIMSLILIQNSKNYSYRLKAGGDSLSFNWKNIYNLLILRVVMLINNSLFELFRFRQYIKSLFGYEDLGIEQALDEQMTNTSRRLGFVQDSD